MKKGFIILVSVIILVILALSVFYCIDMNRMKNNEAVLFSTWGYEYTPPENDTPLKAFQRIEKGTKRNEIIKSFGEPDGQLSGLYGDVYITEGKRVTIYYDVTTDHESIVSDIKITDIEKKEQTRNEGLDVLEVDTSILIQSNGERIKPYEHFKWSEQWTDYGWINADGTNLADELPKICDNLPIITYNDDFQIIYKDRYVSLVGVTVYNEKFESIYNNEEATVLEEMIDGTYYVNFVVKQQGKYVEEDDKYEMSSSNCLYKFIKSTKLKDGFVPNKKNNGTITVAPEDRKEPQIFGNGYYEKVEPKESESNIILLD